MLPYQSVETASARMDPMLAHLKRRAREEQAMAAVASSAEARKAHRELALRYVQVAAEVYAGGASTGEATPAHHDHEAPIIRDRAHLGKVVASAFPLPTSGTFPDLLEAIDGTEGRLTARQD